MSNLDQERLCVAQVITGIMTVAEARAALGRPQLLRPLFHKGKNGELRQWSVEVGLWGSHGWGFRTHYGVVGGEITTSEITFAQGKNVGRANETTAEQQAWKEAEAMWKHKLERKYSLTPEEAQMPLLLPMLAKAYDPKKHGNVGHWLAQPKLDGVRCIARWEGDEIVLTSRQGKEYRLPHITDVLKQYLPPDSIFDGELYVHGVPLQTIISWVKRPQADTLRIEYHVYDMPLCFGVESENDERADWFSDILPSYDEDSPVKAVYTCDICEGSVFKTPEEFEAYCVADGYEGAILRHPEGKYLWGYRSGDLLKVKSFQDAEFEVVGVREGEGKMAGHAIVQCRNDINDLEFDVAPKASMDERRLIFENRDQFVGRLYTVKFFDRTLDGLPRFPVGIAFREDV